MGKPQGLRTVNPTSQKNQTDTSVTFKDLKQTFREDPFVEVT